MEPYPISVPGPSSKRQKQLHLTGNEVREYKRTIEDYLNKVAEDTPPPGKVLMYYKIAADTGIDKDVVKACLYPKISANTTSIAVGNPQLEKETDESG